MQPTDTPVSETLETTVVETPVENPTRDVAETPDPSPAGGTEEVREVPVPSTVVSQPVPEVPPAPYPPDLSRIAQDFQIRKAQVETVLQLLDSGESVPFIARYRREKTLGLPEDLIRRIADRVFEIRAFADRKRVILKSIATHGRLTDELTSAIVNCDHPKYLEDLYVPFKPKKKSLAAEAKLRGWGPLAEAVWTNDPAVADLPAVLTAMVDPDNMAFTTVEDIRTGVMHIVAEQIADTAFVRGAMRGFSYETGTVVGQRVEGVPDDKARDFAEFFEYQEPIKVIPPIRFAILVRGERDRILQLRFAIDPTKSREVVLAQFNGFEGHAHRDFLMTCVDDAIIRLLLPAIEKDIRRNFADLSNQEMSIGFARHLGTMLMQPPVKGRRLLAIDPGFRQGCKLAVLDEAGNFLDHDTIYPHMPQRRVDLAKKKIEFYLRKYELNTVVIGNGPACRETEFLVADLFAEMVERKLNPQKPIESPIVPPAAATPITPAVMSDTATMPVMDVSLSIPSISSPVMTNLEASYVSTTTTGEATVVSTETTTGADVITTAPPAPATPAEPAAPPEPEIDFTGLPETVAGLCYVIVNEAGAAAYANSPAAKAEFPTLDPMTCTAISIGRRLADPLAEYVKFDPQSIGPAFHPQDGRPKHYKELLQGVVESSVNAIGVDVNTAGVSLLKNVSGIATPLAREIVSHRIANGPYTSREQLKTIKGMTDAQFEQCSGFLFIRGGTEPLDETTIHPAQYPVARQLLESLGIPVIDLLDRNKLPLIDEAFRHTNVPELAAKLNIPVPSVVELMEALVKPGYDPRSELPPPVLKSGMLRLEDLSAGMELKGTILNVVPFGAFVDVGTRETGLIHISQMANRYVKSPLDLVTVGDVVTVWVVEVKPGDKKVSLTMIPPVQLRRPEPPPERFERPAPRPERRPEPRQDAPRPERRPEPAREGSGGGNRGGSGGGGQSGGFKPKRFAEPGAWRRGGQPLKPTAKPAEAPAAETAPKKEKKERAKANVQLSNEQKTGKAALNSFGQLFALIKDQETGEGENKETK